MASARMPQALFSKQWWLLLAVTLALAGLGVRLGYWQLDRALVKEKIFAAQAAQADLPALQTQDFGHPPPASQGLYRKVVLQGEWLGQFTIFLNNRTMQGRPGFWVMTPLRLNAQTFVLVQRGWAPRDLVHSDKLPAIETPTGRVTVEGNWVEPPSQMMELSAPHAQNLAQGQFIALRQNMDVGEFARETKLTIVATVRQTGSAAEGLWREWPSALSGADKNRAYAVQWFALAALLGGLFIWFQVFRKISHG